MKSSPNDLTAPLQQRGMGAKDMAQKRKEEFHDAKWDRAEKKGKVTNCCLCKVLHDHHHPKHTPGLIFLKWALPGAMWVGSMFLCIWMLHIATYMYVRLMDRFEMTYDVRWKPGMGPATTQGVHSGDATMHNQEWLNATDYLLSPGIDIHSEVSFGSLEDPLEGYLGWTHVDLHMLDMVSATVPAAWFFATLYTRDLQMWTKSIVANALLAIWKGLFGAMTIVPDSIGWASCKKRLGKANLAYLRDEVPKPEVDGYLAMAWALMKNEAWGHGQNFRAGAGMRFCADMMYSGHTYFTTLYALSLVELVQTRTSKSVASRLLLAFVITFCLGEQILEATLVLKDRFHYTMDVVMAVLLTFLWFTSAPVILAARKWANWDGPFAKGSVEETHGSVAETEDQIMHMPWYKEHFHPESQFRVVHVGSHDAYGEHGDLEVPRCCIPFCCCPGRHHLVRDEKFLHLQTEGLPLQ